MAVIGTITVHLVNELPSGGEHPGDLVVLHGDKQAPRLYIWNQLAEEWIEIN